MFTSSFSDEVGATAVDFNWNSDFSEFSEIPTTIPARPTTRQLQELTILSECLRDGLQGVSGFPGVEDMLGYLRLLEAFGVRSATVGIFPGNRSQSSVKIKDLLARMRVEVPSIVPSVLSLCTDESLAWTDECKHIHPALEAVVFMGSAPSRRLVQGWSLDFIVDRLGTYISRTVSKGIPVVAGTEHSTQTSPEDLRAVTTAQVQGGAYCIGIADTIGIIRPQGANRITAFVRQVLADLGSPEVMIDWHGHRDTGNGLGSALAAVAAGVDRIHVVARGVGERSGNTSLEEVVLNVDAMLEEDGVDSEWDLTHLLELLTYYERMVAIPPPHHGVLGRRFNYTSSGIHADAILKSHRLVDQARRAGNTTLAERFQMMARTVYSAVDPASVGGKLSIGVGPWSGKACVEFVLREKGYESDELRADGIESILAYASKLGRELTLDELDQCIQEQLRGSIV